MSEGVLWAVPPGRRNKMDTKSRSGDAEQTESPPSLKKERIFAWRNQSYKRGSTSRDLC